jgi:N4-gp56 family major capsid protein
MMKIRQFCNVKEAFGKRRGATAMWDKVSNISTAGGTLVETNTIPRSNFTIQQGSVVITEYGNAIDYTLKLETLSEYGVEPAVETVLRNDMAKVIDSAAGVIFASSDLVMVCQNTDTTCLYTNGAASQTSSLVGPSDKNHRDIVDEMKKKLIPTYGGGDYAAVGSVNFWRGLYDYLEASFAYTTREHMYSGEIGRYYGCRIVEETSYLVNTLGASSVSGQGIYVGDDCVWEAIATPEEIRANVPADFGRDQALAWYYLGGFERVWDYSTDTEEHIIFVTSG